MKLKKIVSLALAGVMAVGMLAGCSTANEPNQPTDPTQPASSISTEVGALLDAPEYVTFADSADLDKALEGAVEYAGVLDVMPQYVKVDTLTKVAPNIYNKLGISTNNKLEYIGTQDSLAAAENGCADGYTLPDNVATEMWVVSGSIGENAVKQQIANKLAAVEDFRYAVAEFNGIVGGNFNFTYTVSVSTCTKTVNSSVAGIVGTGVGAADPTVTFVAIQVVRTATHQ